MPVVNVPLGTVRNFKDIEKWLEEMARCHVSFRIITQSLVTGKSQILRKVLDTCGHKGSSKEDYTIAGDRN